MGMGLPAPASAIGMGLHNIPHKKKAACPVNRLLQASELQAHPLPNPPKIRYTFPMKKKSEIPECPVATTVQFIGSKWKLLIVRNLLEQPWRNCLKTQAHASRRQEKKK